LLRRYGPVKNDSDFCNQAITHHRLLSCRNQSPDPNVSIN